MKPRKIAIVRLSAIGDVILTLPAVRAIQRAYPKDKIYWIVSPEAHAVVKSIKDIHFIVTKKPKHPWAYFRYWLMVRRYRFDILLAMQAAFGVNFMYLFTRAKRKIGFDYARARDGQWAVINECIRPGRDHLLDQFLKFASHIGADTQKVEWQLPVAQRDVDFVRSLLPTGRVIAINPNASKKERCWLVERYVALIKRITETYDVSVILTGSGADKVLTQQIAEQTSAIDLAGATSLGQLAALYQEVELLIAPDTGPAHIATAVGTPVIGLYAVAPGELSAPYCSRDLLVDKYALAVKTFLDKDISELRWVTRVHHPKTMSLITVDDVMAKISLTSLVKPA